MKALTTKLGTVWGTKPTISRAISSSSRALRCQCPPSQDRADEPLLTHSHRKAPSRQLRMGTMALKASWPSRVATAMPSLAMLAVWALVNTPPRVMKV